MPILGRGAYALSMVKAKGFLESLTTCCTLRENFWTIVPRVKSTFAALGSFFGYIFIPISALPSNWEKCAVVERPRRASHSF